MTNSCGSRAALFLWLLLSAGVLRAADAVIVVHAQTGYDEKQVTKPAIERVLEGNLQVPAYFLKNDSGEWFVKAHPNTIYLTSQYGEHGISLGDADELVLTGAQLGACLQFTLRDILRGLKSVRPVRIIIPTDAVISIDGNLLKSRLAELDGDDMREAELHRIFSRNISTDRSTRRKRVNIEMPSGKKYSLTDKKLGTPYRSPDLILVIND